MNRTLRRCGLSLAAASLLAACGGGDDAGYSRVVSFGDSLSDAGTYQVTEVAASGGGRFTVNGPDVRLWTDLLARELNVAAPCPAVQGLESNFAASGLTPSARVERRNCFNYAQGGARVTNPIGPNNKATPQQQGGALGHLTEPLVEQVSLHLEKGSGRFDEEELVTVLAGGNDLFVNLGAVGAGQLTGEAAVAAMGTAGTQLAALIREQMVAKGANRVLLVTLPDVSRTPLAYRQDAQTRGLIESMSSSFNTQLQAGIDGVDEVLVVDAFTLSRNQAANPDDYGISNATDPACDPARAIYGSWTCTEDTLVSGDVSRYQFADDVHPTPYGHFLIADAVLGALVRRGWL